MSRLFKRRFGQFLACVAAISFYVIVMSKIGMSSMVIVVPEPPPDRGTLHKDDTMILPFPGPDGSTSLSLQDTAVHLYRQHFSRRNLEYSSSSNDESKPPVKDFDEIQFSQDLLSDDQLAVASEKTLPTFCQNKGFDRKAVTKYPKSTMIVSLIDVTADKAMLLLSKILRHTSEDLIDDIIITAEVAMNVREKDALEQAVDMCSVCRLFFMKGSIHQHRNSVARFARSSILVFVDARIEPFSDFWFEPLIFEVTFNPTAVVSPHLRLREKNTGVVSEGLARVGMTWDMEAIRIPVTSEQNRMLHQDKTLAVNQTSILKEMFAIRKDYFIDLGMFDVFPPSTGGEHISFSLKITNCGGDILTAFCSTVFLDIPDVVNSGHVPTYPRDYESPSFLTGNHNLTKYYESNSEVWLDAYSSNLFSTSIHRQQKTSPTAAGDGDDDDYEGNDSDDSDENETVTSESRHNNRKRASRISHSRSLKAKMKSMECETTNYRYVLTKFQPDMVSIDRKTVKHGFIRSLNGMYAIGMAAQSSSLLPSGLLKSGDVGSVKRLLSLLEDSDRSSSKNGDSGSNNDNNNYNKNRWPTLVLTRNSSQWVGPFSYTMGMVQYNRLWCIAVAYDNNNNDNNNNDNNNNNNNNNDNSHYRITLEPCKSGTASQMFLFQNNVLRWSGHGAKLCVSGAKTTGTGGGRGNNNGNHNHNNNDNKREGPQVSRDLTLTSCADTETKVMNGGDTRFDLLKIDVEFVDGKS